MTTYQILPLTVAYRTADCATFLYHTDAGKEIEIAYRLWVLRGDDRVILVDTGPPLKEANRRGITRVQEIGPLLRAANVEPEQLDTVLLSHLHWDHASNAECFPRAIFYAQKSEIEFFRSHLREHPSMDRYFSHQQFINSLIDNGRIRPVDGDCTIIDGIEAIRVGGHTPGSQIFVVNTAAGKAVITGDAIPLHRNFLENIPSGIVVNVFEAIKTLERVRSMSPVVIYTAHDLQDSLSLNG